MPVNENVPPYILHEWRAVRGNDWVAGKVRVSWSSRYQSFTVRVEGKVLGKVRTYPALVSLLGGLASWPVWTIAE
jgi:hypothetical protein